MSIFTDYDDVQTEQKVNTYAQSTHKSSVLQSPAINYTVHNINQLHTPGAMTYNQNTATDHNNINTIQQQQYNLPLHLQVQLEHELSTYDKQLLLKQNSAIEQANQLKSELLQHALHDAGDNSELCKLANDRFQLANNDMLDEFNSHRQIQLQQYKIQLIQKYQQIALNEPQNNNNNNNNHDNNTSVYSVTTSNVSTPSASSYAPPARELDTSKVIHSPMKQNYVAHNTQQHSNDNLNHHQAIDIHLLHQVYTSFEHLSLDIQNKVQLMNANLKLFKSIIDPHHQPHHNQLSHSHHTNIHKPQSSSSKSMSRPGSAIKPRVSIAKTNLVESNNSNKPTKAILRPTTSYANRRQSINQQPTGFGSSARKSTRPTNNNIRTPATTTSKAMKQPVRSNSVKSNQSNKHITSNKQPQYDNELASNILSAYHSMIHNTDQKINKQSNKSDHRVDAQQFYNDNHFNAVNTMLQNTDQMKSNDPTAQLKQILNSLQMK